MISGIASKIKSEMPMAPPTKTIYYLKCKGANMDEETCYEDDKEVETKELTREEKIQKRKIDFIKNIAQRAERNKSHSAGNAFDDDVLESSFEKDVLAEMQNSINTHKTLQIKQRTIEKIATEHPEFFEQIDWEYNPDDEDQPCEKATPEKKKFLSDEKVAEVKKELVTVQARLAKLKEEYLNLNFGGENTETFGFGQRGLSVYCMANEALLVEEIKMLTNYEMLLMDRLTCNQNTEGLGFGTFSNVYGKKTHD